MNFKKEYYINSLVERIEHSSKFIDYLYKKTN